MKIHPAKQGTPEWLQARAGIPTASRFDQIITPKTRKPSGSQSRLLNTLVAEWLLGRPLETDGSQFMERGKEMEPEAVAAYEWDNDVTTTEVGLCLRDDGAVGASPDRLVGDDGLLEIKCPALTTHVGYMLDSDSLVEAYYVQVQGELWVTGRKWADLFSFNPILPPVQLRVLPDDGFISDLSKYVDGFLLQLEGAKARLQQPYNALRAKAAATEAASDHPF